MGEDVSITVLVCNFREVKKNEPVLSASKTSASTNGDGEYRSADFYKERRELTRSLLCPNATVKETRTAITRGFKKPEPEPGLERKSIGSQMGGLFKRISRRSDKKR